MSAGLRSGQMPRDHQSMENTNRTELPADLLPLAKAARLVPGSSRHGGVDPSTVFRWVQAGKLRSWRAGGRRLVSRAELLSLIREVPAPGQAGQAVGKRPACRAHTATDAGWTDRVLKEMGLDGYG